MTEAYEHHCDDPKSHFLQSGEGKGARVLIVGESLAPDGWRKSGRAFYDAKRDKLIPTGQNLNALLQGFGLSVDGHGESCRCGFTDLVKCYVPGNKALLYECGHRCWPIFERQLKSYDFKLLILLGVDTLKIFNREAGTELRVHELQTVKVFGSEYSVLPIYHPSRPYLNKRNLITFNALRGELDALLEGAA